MNARVFIIIIIMLISSCLYFSHLYNLWEINKGQFKGKYIDNLSVCVTFNICVTKEGKGKERGMLK